MAFKDFTAKQLVVGATGLLTCMVFCAVATYMLYRMVGPGISLACTVVALAWQIIFAIQCKRNPVVRKNHLAMLHKAVWRRWTGKLYAALVLVTIASLIGLLATGWLVTLVLSLVLVVWNLRDVKAAEILL